VSPMASSQVSGGVEGERPANGGGRPDAGSVVAG
jgi:hypothetical protein